MSSYYLTLLLRAAARPQQGHPPSAQEKALPEQRVPNLQHLQMSRWNGLSAAEQIPICKIACHSFLVVSKQQIICTLKKTLLLLKTAMVAYPPGDSPPQLGCSADCSMYTRCITQYPPRYRKRGEKGPY